MQNNFVGVERLRELGWRMRKHYYTDLCIYAGLNSFQKISICILLEAPPFIPTLPSAQRLMSLEQLLDHQGNSVGYRREERKLMLGSRIQWYILYEISESKL